MPRRIFASVAFMAALSVCGTTLFAQSAQKWQPGRTPDGQPDIQGTWLNFDATPFEAPLPPSPEAAAAARATAAINPAPEFADHAHRVSKARKAMVIEPADGRVPVLKWAEDKRDYDIEHIPDAPEHETPWVRCITRGYPAAFFPAGYNNGYQIVQAPGYVIIHYEMIHAARIIPTDGRPHREGLEPSYYGDSTGKWEGDTFVIDTVNFKPWILDDYHYTDPSKSRWHTDALRTTERLQREGNKLKYRITIDDAKIFTRPFSQDFELTQRPDWEPLGLLEYVCEENNRCAGGNCRDSAAR